MKMILAIIASLVLGFAAQAQQYATTTLTNGLKVAGSATVTMSTSAPKIVLTKWENVAITVRTTLDNTGTGAQTYTWQKSPDGSNWDTVNSFVFTLAPGGTAGTYVQLTTNYTASSAGYLRLVSVANGQAGQYSTNNISYTLKPKRYGN